MATRQTRTPNTDIASYRGWCLKYVDDAIGAPARTPSAKSAYDNERAAGRINEGSAPIGVWVVGFMGFTTGPYVEYGHVFLMKKNGPGSFEIHDSEVHAGARGTYGSIEEILRWFGAYAPEYLGFSYACDGATIAEDYTEAAQLAANQRIVSSEGANVRTGPGTNYPMVIQDGQPLVYDKGEVLNGKGFIHGGEANGTDLWFVGISGTKYIHFSNFDSWDTAGLADLTPRSEPTPAPETPAPVVDRFPAPSADVTVTNVVNKKNPLSPLNYAPADLADVGGKVLRSEAAESLKLMMQKAALVPQSGYRSYDYQKTVYNGYLEKDPQAVVDTYSARPGYSEHQTGLAMDFAPIDTVFETTDAFKWLMANAEKYGWVLRFPRGKESVTGYEYEPWHWRYVGVKVATDMRVTGKTTLEEYFGIQGGDYAPISLPDNTNPPQEPSTPENTNTPTPTTPTETPKEVPNMSSFDMERFAELVKASSGTSDYVPVISDRIKTWAYFITDLGAIITAFVLGVVWLLNMMDGEVAIGLIGLTGTFWLGVKQTFRLSSKKQ